MIKCYFCASPATYRCAVCRKPLCSNHVRILPVCNSCISRVHKEFIIVEKAEEDVSEIRRLTSLFWGEEEQLTSDIKLRISELPAYVAKSNGKLVGFISYVPFEENMLIAALAVLPEYQGGGIGKALVLKVEEKARQLSKRRLLVSTSNDDLPALAFYQKLGFQIFEVKPNVIAEKHGQILAGVGGIPIRDEIRLQKILISS